MNHYPLAEPATSVVQHIRGTLGGVPKKTKAMLKKLQAVTWRPAKALDSAALLEEAGFRSTLEALGGVQVIPAGSHPNTVERMTAKNKDKTDTLDLIFKAMKDEALPS